MHAGLQSSLWMDEHSFLPTVLNMAVVIAYDIAFLFISVDKIGTQSMHGKFTEFIHQSTRR